MQLINANTRKLLILNNIEIFISSVNQLCNLISSYKSQAENENYSTHSIISTDRKAEVGGCLVPFRAWAVVVWGSLPTPRLQSPAHSSYLCGSGTQGDAWTRLIRWSHGQTKACARSLTLRDPSALLWERKHNGRWHFKSFSSQVIVEKNQIDVDVKHAFYWPQQNDDRIVCLVIFVF